MATNFSRIILAFIIHADAPGGPAVFFNEMSNFTQMFGSTLYVAQTLLGYAMVVRAQTFPRERPKDTDPWLPRSCTAVTLSGAASCGSSRSRLSSSSGAPVRPATAYAVAEAYIEPSADSDRCRHPLLLRQGRARGLDLRHPTWALDHRLLLHDVCDERHLHRCVPASPLGTTC